MARQIDKWIIALTVMLPTLMVIIDTSVVNVSLDHIRGSLSAGVDESTWSITSYLAANAVIIPMTGWLCRFFGRKQVLILSVVLFTISSLLCGLAWNIQSLIFFRVLQGLAGGSLQPMSQSILLETFPPAQHGTAMAIFGIGTMFGPIMGPLLGGWITDNWSWHWIFFINIPIGIVSLVMSLWFISDPHYMKRTVTSVDYWGLTLLGIWVGCLQMVLDKGQREDWFASDFIIILTIIAVLAFVLFIFAELSAENPIVDLKVFLSYSFSLCNLVIFFVLASLFGGMILLTIYLQSLMGYTASLSGLILGPGGLAIFLVMPIVGWLIRVVNPKLIITDRHCSFMLTANYLMSGFNMSADFQTIIWPRVIMSIGMGMIFIPLTTLALSSIPKEEMGNATSLFGLVRNLGGSVGVAFAATMLSRGAQIHQAHLSEHVTSFDLDYFRAANESAQLLSQRGMDQVTALQGGARVIYNELLRQAYMLSFNDVFFVLAILMICMLPFILFIRYVDHSAVKP